ncbi:unnamed protein product [Peronospora destructor]|uniref:Endonuclease/exonuclease/phosphatase domain-containing protein n=1 Tax=Peronospora destructor TaxID=86335 RepID=A0AAV0VAZ4_9STRA|nr:unnamed protein product [Peronospora destructor]
MDDCDWNPQISGFANGIGAKAEGFGAIMLAVIVGSLLDDIAKGHVVEEEDWDEEEKGKFKMSTLPFPASCATSIFVSLPLSGTYTFTFTWYTVRFTPWIVLVCSALPRHLDDSSVYLVLGDLNMTMDPNSDQATPGATFHDSGRAELFDWMISLGLIDFWRLKHPDVREFTGPKSKNRIDYYLTSIDFYDTFFRSSRHLLGSTFGRADHVPMEFSTSSDDTPSGDSLPFKCPPWLLKRDTIQDHLRHNLHVWQHLSIQSKPRVFVG